MHACTTPGALVRLERAPKRGPVRQRVRACMLLSLHMSPEPTRARRLRALSLLPWGPWPAPPRLHPACPAWSRIGCWLAPGWVADEVKSEESTRTPAGRGQVPASGPEDVCVVRIDGWGWAGSLAGWLAVFSSAAACAVRESSRGAQEQGGPPPCRVSHNPPASRLATPSSMPTSLPANQPPHGPTAPSYFCSCFYPGIPASLAVGRHAIPPHRRAARLGLHAHACKCRPFPTLFPPRRDTRGGATAGSGARQPGAEDPSEAGRRGGKRAKGERRRWGRQ